MHSRVMSRNRLTANLVGAPCAHPPHAVGSAAPSEDKEWETEEGKGSREFSVGNAQPACTGGQAAACNARL